MTDAPDREHGWTRRDCGMLLSEDTFTGSGPVSQITAEASLALARKHLERVLDSWSPTRWLDLAAYGLYALEAAVVAAALHHNMAHKRTHGSKADVAALLAQEHGLPDIGELMRSLNEIRKSEAYGDVAVPARMDPEEIAQQVEQYVDRVSEQFAS